MSAASAARPADSLESHRTQDINGFWEIRDNPISKVGVFMYSGRVIGMGLPPDEMFAVFRPPEELADPECASSFRLQPWVDNHPKKLFGDPESGLIDPARAPIAGVLGEQIYFDENDFQLKANLKLFNFAHEARIDEGKKELSIGYRCIYERESGEYNGIPYQFVQRKIRGNHIASVGAGRSGPEISVMDGAVEAIEEFTATFDNAEYMNMATKNPTKKTIAKITAPVFAKKATSYFKDLARYAADAEEEAKKEGGDGKAAGEFKQLADLLAQAQPLLTAIAALPAMAEAPEATVEDEDVMDKEGEGGGEVKPKEGEAPAAKPGMENKPKDGEAMDSKEIIRIATEAAVKAVTEAVKPIAAKAAVAMDAAEMHKEIQRKTALYDQVKPFVGVFDAAEMTSAQVAKYACDKLKLNAPEGQEQVALSAFLVGRRRPRPVDGVAMDGKEAKDAKASLRAKMMGQKPEAAK